MTLESLQAYDFLWHMPGDVHARLHCQRCNALLPEGATEDDELCEDCKQEEGGNNGEPIKNYPEDDWREDR